MLLLSREIVTQNQLRECHALQLTERHIRALRAGISRVQGTKKSFGYLPVNENFDAISFPLLLMLSIATACQQSFSSDTLTCSTGQTR